MTIYYKNQYTVRSLIPRPAQSTWTGDETLEQEPCIKRANLGKVCGEGDQRFIALLFICTQLHALF